jgi:hypothetical protein
VQPNAVPMRENVGAPESAPLAQIVRAALPPCQWLFKYRALMSTLSVDDLLPHAEITRLLHFYCPAVDRHDAKLLASVYQPDAHEDHLFYRGPAVGFVPAVINELAADTFGLHDLGTSLIEVHGTCANAETYYISHRGRPHADGGEYLISSGGRYLDRLERRADGPWLISSRAVTREWRQLHGQASVAEPAYPLGPEP